MNTEETSTTEVTAPTRDILKPFFDKVSAHFPNTRVRVTLVFENDYEMVDGKKVYNKEERQIYSAGVTIGEVMESNNCFLASTLEEAFSQAKASYTIKDPVRLQAAEKLRQQAARIENGLEPIPS